jgi:hypothetical protein
MRKDDLSSMSQYQHSLEARILRIYPIFQLLIEGLNAAKYNYKSMDNGNNTVSRY